MPNVLLNLWGCNEWLRENDREAAMAESQCGAAWGMTVDEVIFEVQTQLEADTFYTSEQGSPYTAAEWYASLTADWPELGPVIDPNLFISMTSGEAKDYWREHWWKGTEDDHIQCFDYAHYQLIVADFYTTGWLPETTTYQVYRDDTGVNLNETAEGVRYLKQALAEGTPVLTGLQLTSWSRRPNPDKTTNHFVVIVGMGVDEQGHYLLYYDYLKDSDGMKFYVKPDLVIESLDGRFRAAQIRQSRPL